MNGEDTRPRRRAATVHDYNYDFNNSHGVMDWAMMETSTGATKRKSSMAGAMPCLGDSKWQDWVSW